MNRIRVLLVDDQALFVESLRTVIEHLAEDIEVAGVARNGAEALAFMSGAPTASAEAAGAPVRNVADGETIGGASGATAREARADLVVMDVRMPVMDGVEATKRILKACPGTRIMMLTTFEDDEYVKEALEHGAVGYILKDIPPPELVAAIRAVAGGSFIVAPSVARSLIRRAYLKPEFAPAPEPEWLRSLSRREREILGHLVEGHSNKEIAYELCIAEQTVRNHVTVIYDKMGVDDRAQAVRLARETGTKT